MNDERPTARATLVAALLVGLDFWGLDDYLCERQGLATGTEYTALLDDLDAALGDDWTVLLGDAASLDAFDKDRFNIDDWRDYYTHEALGEPPAEGELLPTMRQVHDVLDALVGDELVLVRA